MFNYRNPRKLASIKSLEKHLAELPEKLSLTLDQPGTNSLAGWFLGPKAENEELFTELIREAIERHCQDRRTFYPDDPIYVTEKMKNSREYKRTVADFRAHLDTLLKRLQGSVPFFSYRYQAHMNWDLTMAGMIGYFAAMLYNPNNVAAEASPVTTPLEMEVGDDLCEMLGYRIPANPKSTAIRPWGHITCDGSVANLEAMWASRNLKYYPVALAAALKEDSQLSAARGMRIPLPTGGSGVIIELDDWQLLNLLPDDVLNLPTRMQNEYNISTDTLTDVMNNYSIQNLGFQDFYARYLKNTPTPIMFAPSTMHYSWPKAAAVLGLGMNQVFPIYVNLDARMEADHLRIKLDECLAQKRPVIMTVAVIGSTEESAVDPLADVIALRDEYTKRGLVFTVHADAAWGGYFASILRPDPHDNGTSNLLAGRQFTPEMCMSPYVNKQYRALKNCDSITIDPHKAGYIPYPAGGLCYRNGSMRYLVAFTAPVVYHGGIDPTVGVYGIEGSKPGAAATGVYLSHRVVRTNRSGYGKILGQSLFNSKRLYSALVTMASDDDPFIIVPFNRLPAEKEGAPPPIVKKQLEYIRTDIVPKTNDELIRDPEAMKLLRQLGSDQIIVAYAFNFKKDGVLNQDVTQLNNLNNAIYALLSISPQDDDRPPMIVTSSDFEPDIYGKAFMDTFKLRLGVQGDDSANIAFLLSTTQDPWVTDTAEGNFIPTIIEALRGAVLKAIKQIEKPAPSTNVESQSSTNGRSNGRQGGKKTAAKTSRKTGKKAAQRA